MSEIFGLMQDKQLMISDFIGYAQKYHPSREIVSRDEEGSTHRYTYGEAGPRARRLSSALLQAGVERGDRIATLAMNGYRHFELFYGVSGIGAILHTVNPRLFEEQLVYILAHAGSRMLFVDPAFIPLARKLVARLPAMERVVVLADHDADDWESYESFIGQGDALYGWPVFDERTASSLCYTSGTTGNPRVSRLFRQPYRKPQACGDRRLRGAALDDRAAREPLWLHRSAGVGYDGDQPAGHDVHADAGLGYAVSARPAQEAADGGSGAVRHGVEDRRSERRTSFPRRQKSWRPLGA